MKIIPNFFTKEECDDIVLKYKQKLKPALSHYRATKYEAATKCYQEMVSDDDISNLFQDALRKHDVVPESNWMLYDKLRIVHYDKGQGIGKHTDAIFSNEKYKTKYTCFVYLTEGHIGGNTRVYHVDGTTTDVVPEIGTALFFEISTTPHAGLPLESKDNKMIVIAKILTKE